jgi:Ran GTPase-activating protein (RanGAP) involved in mRNA processing and transport
MQHRHLWKHLLTTTWYNGHLKDAVQLTYLNLSDNSLGSPATNELLEVLHLAPLRHLHLSGCDLDAHCARGLAFLLDNSLVLESVDMSWNRLGPAGCKTIAQSLQFNQSLVSFDLSFNALGAAGGAYMGDVLFDNRYDFGATQTKTL